MSQKINIGVVGCGNILGQYVRGCRQFEILHLSAFADIIPDKAKTAAESFDIPRVLSVESLLADSQIDVVLNLTVPRAHAEITLAAIAQGKHVYSEKPLATTREDGQKIMRKAAEAGVAIGCAPDTFLGAGLQACRSLLDQGVIGHPVAANAVFMSSGPERWHPNPGFFYLPGGGPLFDMGPYYLSALIHLLGPADYLSAEAHITYPERVAGHPDRLGERLPVEVPTFVAALLHFANAVPATLITTFDVWSSEIPRIEIYGSEGTLSVPDPNTFGGPVRYRRKEDKEWQEMPISGWQEVGRGIGLADMAHALVGGRGHRASGDLAFHVLDIMESIYEAAQSGQRTNLNSTTIRPASIPENLPAGILDD